MNAKSDDEDSESEFEDAVDSLPLSPHYRRFPAPSSLSSQSMQQQTSANDKFAFSPMTRLSESDVRRSSFPTTLNSPSTSTMGQSELSMPPSARNATTRHGRLEVLRNRMRQEFGVPSSGPYTGDELSTTSQLHSDCTSLASWGRNLLAEQQANVAAGNSLCAVVRAADSLSTRATPVPPLNFCGENNEVETRNGANHGGEASQSFQGHSSSHFLFDGPSTSDYAKPLENVGDISVSEKLHTSEKQKLSLLAHGEKISACASEKTPANPSSSDERRMSLSPPLHPPPPLPIFLSKNYECDENFPKNVSGGSEIVLPASPPPRAPPLPPRRPNVVTPKLPSALPSDVSSLQIPLASPQEFSEQQQPLPQVQQNQQQLQQSNSLSPKRNASESHAVDEVKCSKTSLFFDDFGMKRGHAKTNSLDRGLSLAKSMKSGPFPPPSSSKSNSLNRDVSPSDAMAAVCEEDQRINTAHGVIQQLTFSVLSSPSSSLNASGTIPANSPAHTQLQQHTPRHETKKSFASGIVEKIKTSSVSKFSTQRHHEKRSAGNSSGSTPTGHTITTLLYPSLSASKNLAAVGEEVASVSSAASIPPQTKPYANPHYENLSIDPTMLNENSSVKFDALEVKKQEDQKSGISESRSLKDSISSPNLRVDANANETTDNNEKMLKSNSLPRESDKNLLVRSKSSTLHHMDSIDPVTRDVQRRMSLSSSDSLHKRSPVSTSALAGINQVKNAARSYGTAASGFFRGAVRRAKTAVTSNRGSKTLKNGVENDADEEGGRDSSESDDDGITSISENLPPSVAGGPKMSIQSTCAPEITPSICRPKNTKKGPFDFEQLRLAQELSNEHTGAVWCVKFSVCGRLFATGGQDNIVRVWVLKNYLNYFTRMRERYSQEGGGSPQQNILQDKLLRFSSMQDDIENLRMQEDMRSDVATTTNDSQDSQSEVNSTADFAATAASGDSLPSASGSSNSSPSSVVVAPKPFCVFRGHTADVLDLSWSPRNYFILSSGIDRTVKLWHLTRNECLCCFQHMDFVTCIAFMPKDDRYFISGCMDGKIRLWHIPEKKVALWNEVEQSKFITAITFVRNGKFVVVGTYNGRCFFYSTDQLKYHTVIDVRSTRGKNARGHKITSLAVHGDKLLITSNDSRIRMYDLRDMNLTRKFKGAQIERSQIRASFSPNGRHIISGSEDNYIYIWRTGDLPPTISVRKDRNPMWERTRAHNSVVTAAIFAPKPSLFFSRLAAESTNQTATNGATVMKRREFCGGENMRSGAKHSTKTIHSGRSASIASSSGIGLELSISTNTNGGSARNRLFELSKISRNGQATGLSMTSNLTSSLLSNSLSNSGDNSSSNKLTSSKPTHSSTTSKTNTKISASRGTSSSAANSGYGETHAVAGDVEMFGDVIVSADVRGSLKIFTNPTRLRAGASSFFPH